MVRKRVNKKTTGQKCFNIDLGKAFTLSAMLGLVSFAPQTAGAAESDFNQTISVTNDFTTLSNQANNENVSYSNQLLDLNENTQISGGGNLFKLVIRAFWRLHINSGSFCFGG